MNQERSPADLTKDKNPYGLNLNQKRFAEYYILGGDNNEFRIGNATHSYAKAYSYDLSEEGKADICSGEGSKLLRNPKVKKYMRDVLEASGWNDEAMDARLKQIGFTGKDADSINAIKEFNKIKKRVTDKLEFEGEVNFRIALPPKRKGGDANAHTD